VGAGSGVPSAAAAAAIVPPPPPAALLPAGTGAPDGLVWVRRCTDSHFGAQKPCAGGRWECRRRRQTQEVVGLLPERRNDLHTRQLAPERPKGPWPCGAFDATVEGLSRTRASGAHSI